MAVQGDTLFLACVLLALAATVGAFIVHMLTWFEEGVHLGFVHMTSKEKWMNTELEIIDVTWIFILLIVVYVYQIIWIIYAITAIARRTKRSKKSPLVDPPLLPPWVFILYIIGLAGLMAWLILQDNYNLQKWSMAALACAIIFLCASTGSALCAASQHLFTLQAGKYDIEIWSLRILVHNGLALISTWAVTVTMLTLAHLLIIYGYTSKDISQYIAIGVIMTYLALWCSMDVFLTYKVTDFVITPYLLTIVIFLMSFMHNLPDKNLHFSISAVFLAISLLLVFFKMIVACIRGRYSNKFSKFDVEDISKTYMRGPGNLTTPAETTFDKASLIRTKF